MNLEASLWRPGTLAQPADTNGKIQPELRVSYTVFVSVIHVREDSCIQTEPSMISVDSSQRFLRFLSQALTAVALREGMHSVPSLDIDTEGRVSLTVYINTHRFVLKDTAVEVNPQLNCSVTRDTRPDVR